MCVVVLLAAFVAALAYLVRDSRGQEALHSHEVDEAGEERHSFGVALSLTALGIVVIGVGDELLAQGAERRVATPSVPALVMGTL